MNTITRAIQVFIGGYCFTQSFTHPYVAEQIGPLWVMRDRPRRRGDYRTEEWVAHGVAPAEVDRIVRQEGRERYVICQINQLPESLEAPKQAYKTLGYRLVRSEPLMIHSLAQLEQVAGPATIQRVMTAELANRLTEATVVRQILPVHFTPDAPLRAYTALLDEQIVGWVRSIQVKDATWCSNMYVRPEFRRRGIARSLLSQMLQDDAASGAKLAVLLASQTGAKLYPTVGYTQIGTLLLFTPRK
jgi:GNAT superfamily N-acetyltransferase